MKLIRVIDDKDHVTIDTVKRIKIFGFVLFERKASFKKMKDEKNWINIKSKKAATPKETKRLDFWLYNHEKFVAGTLRG